jgi:hypothetical protein
MLQYVKFLHDIYKDVKDDSKKKALLRNIIRAEARLNNDLAGVIARSNPKEVAISSPILFEQFETTSFELLTTLAVSAHEVFEEERDPTEKELESLDKGSNSLSYFGSRPQSELYEFYIRKAKLLASLSRSKAIATANVGLATRIKNIEYATRFLTKRLK